MKAEPLVSIIVVCYDQSAFVVECLESVRLQTYKNIELIIIDDASEDDSVAVIESWIATHDIQPVLIAHHVNEGICRTFNEALSYASGKYISIIAADDVYMPHKTETQVALFETLPTNAGVIYSDALRIDADGKSLPHNFIETYRAFEVMPQGNLFGELLQGNFIPAMSTMVRRECYDAVGPYDEQLSYEDFDMWLRIARDYEFYFSPLMLAKYRIVPTSLSHTVNIEGTWELLKSDFRIYEKCLSADLSREQQELSRQRLAGIAKQMYARQYVAHIRYMMKWVRYDFSLLTVAFLLCALARIPHERLTRLGRVCRALRDKLFGTGYSPARNIVRE